MANRPAFVPGERRAIKGEEGGGREKNETAVLREIGYIRQTFYTN